MKNDSTNVSNLFNNYFPFLTQIYCFLNSEESNFHVFYYLYDGLMSKNLHTTYHLADELRKQHAYLTADKQDQETKKVTWFRSIYWLVIMISSISIGHKEGSINYHDFPLYSIIYSNSKK